MMSMRPLPTHQSNSTGAKATSAEPRTLELGPLSGSAPSPNRKATCPVQRAYPWLLVISTGLAAVFCGLYLTKPVVLASTVASTAPLSSSPSLPGEKDAASPSLLPSDAHLPGEAPHSRPTPADPRGMIPASAAAPANPFEETNIRVQHVLAAQGPDGENLGKIILDVPVLYRSRSLRWTPDQVEKARELLTRIGDFKERSRALREEAEVLMASWNDLMEDSIPAGALRADSPSLPSNQSPSASSGGWETTRAIEVQKD